jgi:poly(A) polymerase
VTTPAEQAQALVRLAAAPWLASPDTQAVFALLDGVDGRARAVGGIVRDTLLGVVRPDAEVDFSTEYLPEEVMERAQRAGYAAHPTGIAHGTVTLRVGGLTAEVTTLRQDVETDGRHAVVHFGTDWRRDAERRDFTMNALYAGMDGTVFDPIGGLADCLARNVRFIGDPDRRIAEDRLRVFRFFRFSASHGRGAEGRFDPAGLAACRRAAGRLDRLSAERVGAEMRRILSLTVSAPVIATMAEAGILRLRPQAVAGLSALEALMKPAPASLVQRLAILAGDVDGLDTLKRAWRLPNALVRDAAALLGLVPLLAAGEVVRALSLSPDAVQSAVPVTATLDKRPPEWAAAVAAQVAGLMHKGTGKRFPLRGTDLIAHGVREGPAIGAELERLRQVWIESGFTLDRSELLSRARI